MNKSMLKLILVSATVSLALLAPAAQAEDQDLPRDTGVLLKAVTPNVVIGR